MRDKTCICIYWLYAGKSVCCITGCQSGMGISGWKLQWYLGFSQWQSAF